MELIRKMVNLAFGAWSVTREKVEQTADDLIKRGEISSEEAKKFVDEMLSKIEESKKEIDIKIENIVEKTLQKMHVPSRSEVEQLQTQLTEVKEELKALKTSISAKEKKTDKP
ncbi:MAG: phasin family protein [Candidatus Auribacterota bacterium]|jgi:polyhydroxyalkanoate synthesis regulator phasin|uniref:Polyhydroxyalkanoate synthesis regulator n=1 Tax=Candidatus Auribacter fodinae TaxID=2093366 RepID=A0A3A4R2Z3_9BACT|nr:MAG: hypothetical protein C4541_06320 [Candidatus Auribacter fodinae]